MKTKTQTFSAGAALLASVLLGACVFLSAADASAAAQYLDDGGEQNASGGWDMPKSTAGTGNLGQGSCVPDASKLTRPECVALRLNCSTNADCVRSTTATPTPGCGGSWSTSAVCNDTETDQVSCEAQAGRMWNAATGICSLTLKGRNRNQAACEDLGGTWAVGVPGTCAGVWTLPDSSTYTPPLLRPVGANPSTGDQCLRCHNSITEWNTNRVRDVEGFLKTGHKNMTRKVVPGSGLPWSGPDGNPYVTNDAGLPFNWTTGTLNGNPVAWIYGDWLSPLPRAVVPALGGSYTCGRCHTTGWVNSADATMEPEASFPGIRGSLSITGSWDLFGITCTRCHGSAVEDSGGSCSVANLFTSASCTAGGGTWTAGGALPSALGMTTHATNLVAYDGGYCAGTESQGQRGQSNKLQCEFFSGTWYSMCSDDRWQSSALCLGSAGCINPATNHGLTYTKESDCEAATAGECDNPFFTASAPCAAGGGIWTPATSTWWTTKSGGQWSAGSCSVGVGVCTAPQYTASGTCTGAGGTWGALCSNPRYTSSSTCTTAGATWSTGACTVPSATTAAACKTSYGLWSSSWTDLFRCMDAGGTWSGTDTRRGQRITAVCMDCHRQETSNNPYDSTDPAGNLKVGPAHGTTAFVSHPHSNEFLNSPHGQFTGTFAQVGSATYGAGYGSYFQFLGEAANTGNGCTGCHDVHKSVVKETGQEGAIREECNECHAKNLAVMAHPQGPGTPLENMATDPAEACEICHMPGLEHLFRINTDSTYSVFPPSAFALNSGVVNANTAADGGYAKAVWVDLDQACGQCHGGGNAQAFTTGNLTNGSKIVPVASGTGFVAGGRVVIAGAGALGEDGVTRGDLETYVQSVSGNQLTLVGAAGVSLTGTSIEQNPTKNGGAYLTKAELGMLAKSIHADAPTVAFGYMLGSPNTLTVNVDASASSCAGAVCDAYDWDWGDGTAHGSGVTASHTYATAGNKVITLTVEKFGVSSGSLTKKVTVYAPDYPPTVGGLCTFDANTWIETVTDTSTDDHAVKQVTVNWGDGSMLSNDTLAPFGSFSHAYTRAGTFTITHKAIDTIGQQSSTTCTASPAYFSISGTVKNRLGTANLGSAVVTVKKSGVTVKTVYTSGTGTFSAGTLKPGVYTLTVTKSGYTFAVPAATITIGPSGSVGTINATLP